jgi:hypothetical protein
VAECFLQNNTEDQYEMVGKAAKIKVAAIKSLKLKSCRIHIDYLIMLLHQTFRKIRKTTIKYFVARSHTGLGVQPQHEFIAFRVDHFFSYVEVGKLMHGNCERDVALNQLKDALVENGSR